MALTSNEMGAADIAAITGGRGYNDGFGNDAWWIILFLFAMNGGWGNGFGGGNMMFPYYFNNTDNNVTRGFDNAGLASQLSGIQSSISNGFASSEVADCNRAMNAMQTAYNNQIASMNQNFANAQALDARLDNMTLAQQECCCENRAAIADLKYTVATEACADRATVNNALRDVIASNTANTQRILDQLCADKIDAKNDEIAQLRQELLYSRGQASQIAQNSSIINGIYDRLNQCPVGTVPVYGEQPIFTCNNNAGCGCGGF